MKNFRVNRRPARRRTGRSAFTLLELMISMLLVSIVALTLAGSLRIAFKARDNAEASVAPARGADVAAEILRVDLESALLPRGQFAGPFIGSDSVGAGGLDSDSLTFHAAAPAGDEALDLALGLPQGDIRRVELALATVPDTNETALVRRVKNNLVTRVETDQTHDEVLCRHVVGFGLRYYDGLTWRDTWDSSQEENRLPQAVEVTLDIQRPTTAGQAEQLPVRQSRIIRLPCATQLPQEEPGSEVDPAAAAP
jgi:prepilin-type N-terminal cleavage/methylation domain-containing protein